MFERFSSGARHAVVQAQREARRLDHPIVGTEHLLLGLLDDRDGLAARALCRLGISPAGVRASIKEAVEPARRQLDADALASIGIDLDAVRTRVEESFGPGALERTPGCRRGPHRGYMPISPRAKKVLELSLREAIRRKSGTIGTEHLLLGILREGNGLAALLLAKAGVDGPAVEAAIDGIHPDDGTARGGQADTG